MDEGNPSTVAVSAMAVTSVLAKRVGNRRVAYSIANVGSNSVFLSPSNTAPAAANAGIYLAPGGVANDSDATRYECWSGTITAYSTAGTTLSVWERAI